MRSGAVCVAAASISAKSVRSALVFGLSAIAPEAAGDPALPREPLSGWPGAGAGEGVESSPATQTGAASGADPLLGVFVELLEGGADARLGDGLP